MSDDFDPQWNKFEWQQYYRLRHVVGELGKAVGFAGGGLFAFLAYKYSGEWGWDHGFRVAAAITAFLVAAILIFRELDLDR